MKKAIYLSLFVILPLLFCMHAGAQKGHVVIGAVQDSSKSPLRGSTVQLINSNGDTATTTATANGWFVFHNVMGDKIIIIASAIGYETMKKHYVLGGDTTTAMLGTIVLQAQANVLDPVTVKYAGSAVTIKEDTVSYNASAYKVRDNAPLEDILKKLPGVDVDADGNVTAQGKQVTKVRVNGKDFFGGDVKTATKNLPADLVESVQMIDDYGDQANLTGVKTGEPDKIMNITIRPDKNHGYTGQLTVGEGEDALPKKPGVTNDNRYAALFNGFRFNGDQQIAVLGNINNTNLNTFSFGSPNMGVGGDLAKKIAVDGAMVGKLSISVCPGSGGNFSSQAATQNGITNTHSAGFNYRDQLAKSLSLYGSYSFADNTVVTQSNTYQQNTSPTNPGSSTSNSNQTAVNINHRVNWNIEYKPDTVNYLKVIPSFSYASTNSNSLENVSSLKNGVVNQAYTTNINGNSTSPNYGLTALYNHRFNGHGRNFSVNLTINNTTFSQYQNPVYNYTTGSSAAPLNQMINTCSHSENYGATLSYLEPLGTYKYLELNYAFNRSYTFNNKQTSALDSVSHGFLPDSALSNRYNYIFTTNRFGINYRYAKKTFNYTIGADLEPSSLNGNSPLTGSQTQANTLNFAPVARFVFNFSRNRSFSINYNGSSSQPTFTQLQPVIDFSNALYPVEGNPKLQPQFTNNFSMHYNRFDFASGNSFFTTLSLSQTQNQVVTNTTTFPAKYLPDPALANTYLTQYTNANGNYTATAFASFAKPWHNRRYTLMFNGTATYTNNIGYLTNVDSITYAQTTQRNIAKNIMVTPSMRFRIDIPDKIDAQLSAGYSISETGNLVNNNFTNASANIRTLNLGVSGKNYVKKDWTLSYEYSKAVNYGYSLPVTNPNILNMYIERRFLKNNKATVRFAAFDIFNQNTGYSSTTTASAITQTVVNRLGRYYLLTFTLRLQKFAGR